MSQAAMLYLIKFHTFHIFLVEVHTNKAKIESRPNYATATRVCNSNVQIRIAGSSDCTQLTLKLL